MASPYQRPQGADDRRVGELTVRLLDGLPAEHERVARGGTALELPDQSCLADAGLTAQQHHDRGFARRFTQGELQLREFPGAPDEVT